MQFLLAMLMAIYQNNVCKNVDDAIKELQSPAERLSKYFAENQNKGTKIIVTFNSFITEGPII